MLYQRIRCFLEVAACLSFSTAARNLYISQQAVTRQIAALEEEIGRPLFINTKNHLSLTEYGAYLALAGQETLDAFDLLGEGIFMPLGGLTMTILLGWTRRHYLDDEIEHGSPYRTKGFVNFSMRYIAPILMAFIVFIQISTFFFSKTAWFQALMG